MPQTGTSKYPQLLDIAWLTEQYVTLGRSTIEIAAEIGCGASSVQWRLTRAGVPMRGKYSGRWEPKLCERCEKEFTPAGPAQRFCSPACRAGTRECEQCGKTFQLKLTTDPHATANPRRFCTPECGAMWRSENLSHRYLTGEGYVLIVKPPTMSRGLNDQGYVRVNLGTGRLARGRVLEHRYVMEQQLGRELLPDETVHHVNGQKTDNRPENLELWVSKHPKGQRVEDVVEWATEMLQRYAPDRLKPVRRPAGQEREQQQGSRLL